MKQLFFKLQPENPYALEYLVSHTGIVDATSRLAEVVEEANVNRQKFYFLYIFGAKGSGKTHIAKAYSSLSECCSLYDISLAAELNESFVASFVSDYETKRTHGGLIIFSASELPGAISTNPHLSSRLQSAELLTLGYPQESELRTLINSILERRNLNISEYSLGYLLKRLPANPLSFEDIFARIDELSLSQSKPAGLGLIRKAFINNGED